MRILKIGFENINSLKGPHILDFSENPLSSAGIFAITGPTGTGKTTILDVITLALFDRIPRIDEKISRGLIERTGLILTRNMRECFAEVTYECKKGTFTSKWSISRAKRTGTLQDYEMELSDSENNLIPLKKTEVPAMNEEQIGLNYDQFVKAIILAQGDFAAFLKARGDERGKLLEQVTGSWIYRELGKAAYGRNKLFGQALELLQVRESELKGRLLDRDAYDLLIRELTGCEKEREAVDTEIRKLTGQKELKDRITRLSGTVAKAENAEMQIKDEWNNFFAANGARMERHRKLMPFERSLWEWQRLGITVNDNSEKFLRITNDLAACRNKSMDIEREVLDLTGSSEGIQAALNAFEKKVLEIEREKGEVDALVKSKSPDITRNLKELGMEPDISDPEKSLNAAAKLLAAKEPLIGGLRAKLDPEMLESPEEMIRILREHHGNAGACNTDKARLDYKAASLADEQGALENIQKSLAELPGQIKKAGEEKEWARLILDNLNKEKRIRELSASLEDHRKRLNEGEPCPLCGSTVHPYRGKAPVFADNLDKSIKDAEEADNAAGRKLISLETLLKQYMDDHEKKKRSIQNLIKEIDGLRDLYSTHLASLPEACRLMEPQEVLASLKSRIGSLDEFIRLSALKSKLNEVITNLKGIAGLMAASAELKTRRYAIFKGSDVRSVTGAIMKQYTGNIAFQEKLLSDKNELSLKDAGDKKDLEALEKTLKNDLAGYTDPAMALRDLIPANEYQALNNEEGRLQTALAGKRAELKAARESLGEAMAQDVDRTIDEIVTEIQKFRTDLVGLNEKRDGLAAKKRIHEDSIDALAVLEAEMNVQKAAGEKWVLLNKYIGDAEGRRFSTFAQQLTLYQLVRLANRRLKMLNDRYRLEMPEEDKDDSLDVIDTHMGDLRRSVKSLSGGESFLVSLSLALALSDLASRQVDIKSLFIDEGFGSLDKITLDQTIDTLEKLQYETSKTIGVISHIEAMQERISTQIRLSKNGQGYSSLEIVQ